MTDRRRAAYNSTFAIGGVSCSADSFVVAESFVLRINFCSKIPPIANLHNIIGNSNGDLADIKRQDIEQTLKTTSNKYDRTSN
jgi:hypothetical protein